MKKREFDKKRTGKATASSTSLSGTSPAQEVRTVSDQAFHEDLNSVLRDSEAFRLQQMAKYRSREFLSMTATLLSVLLGGSAFAWYLLMEGNLFLAVPCMMAAIIPHIFMHPWVQEPVKTYQKLYKDQFMPRIADSMGGLQFHANRGIKRNVLAKTGIVPAHDTYSAEDCFFGHYKNAKITLSEARLLRKDKRDKMAFDGIFVLIELSKPHFEGHSVITMDPKQAQRLAKRLQAVPLRNAPQFANHFHLLSSKPDKASILDSPELFKELQETALLFDNAALSIAFFASKYIFVQIPYENDMFEASDVFVPITNNDAAMRCKKEVEQLMSIVDIVHLYDDADIQEENLDDVPDIMGDLREAAAPTSPHAG